MNETFQLIILSLVQGITEFLPISSSAHLIILPEILSWDHQGIVFDVTMHFGSLMAITYYYFQNKDKRHKGTLILVKFLLALLLFFSLDIFIMII